MKIYVLTWYLSEEDKYISKMITNKSICENQYKELKEILPKYSWISMKEYIENEDHELIESEVLHYNDI